MLQNTFAALLGALILLLAPPAAAQDRPAGPPQLKFKVVENFLHFPDNVYFAEVVGVALNSKGHLFVVNRGPHALMEFDEKGNYVRSIGDGLPMFEGPHQVRVDPQDNLWYIDAGNNLVVRFDPQQKQLTQVFGRRPEPWTWKTHVIEHAIPAPQNFYQPTDVTFGPDGSLYVSDGYGNSRVAKFGKDGVFQKAWGERGTQPGQFNTPHSIVIDAKGMIYVADRANARIQLVDTEGALKGEWRVGGPPWSLCLTPAPNQVMYVGSVGKVIKVSLEGKVLGVMGKQGLAPGMFDWVHGIACPDEHTVYAAQELSWRLDKLIVE